MCVKCALKIVFSSLKISKTLEIQGFSEMWDYSHSILRLVLQIVDGWFHLDYIRNSSYLTRFLLNEKLLCTFCVLQNQVFFISQTMKIPERRLTWTQKNRKILCQKNSWTHQTFANWCKFLVQQHIELWKRWMTSWTRKERSPWLAKYLQNIFLNGYICRVPFKCSE